MARAGSKPRGIGSSVARTAWQSAGPIAALSVWAALAAAGVAYPELRSAAVGRCEAIDPRATPSGRFFNPDGYRSYYLRSLCFQEAAVAFRDPALCRRVKRRRSLFSSSWGYSRQNCEKLVDEGVRADRESIRALKRAYAQGHVRISDFRIEPNDNGRDFDMIPSFAGAGGHAYTLRFELLPTDSPPLLLHESGYFLKGPGDSVRVSLPAAEIRARFPAFEPTERYTVRATLEYSIGAGGENGRWSDAFIETEFPADARREQLQKTLAFAEPAPRAAGDPPSQLWKRATNSSDVLTFGYGVAGVGTPRNLQIGSQPWPGS
jgi:hypothetical protein